MPAFSPPLPEDTVELPITEEVDLVSWIRLSLVEGLGPRYLARLLKHYPSPAQVLAASAAELAQCGIPARVAAAVRAGANPQQVDKTLRWLETAGNRILTWADAEYPQTLLQIADPPPLLYLKGQIQWLNRPMLAIVGSRHASPDGLYHAQAFAEALSHCGWTIVSGLAQGIDTQAHLGGLAAAGSTIAVTGTGADLVYPASNLALAHRIATEGALLSELPLGIPARAGNFPRRNRIISGLARGVLVVEAGTRSGSLITAREALEQGHEVFALPGAIHAPLSKGCNLLIKQGAKLVESVDDILEEFPDVRSAPVSGVRSAQRSDVRSAKRATFPSPPSAPAPVRRAALQDAHEADEGGQAVSEKMLRKPPRPEQASHTDTPRPSASERARDHNSAVERQSDAVSSDPISQSLLAQLAFDQATDIDTLAARSALSPEQMQSGLLHLELAGLVKRLPGGRYRRV